MKNSLTKNHENLANLAIKASAGTLRRVHAASGNDIIRKMRGALQADITLLDNKNIDNTVSYAYDLAQTAYCYMLSRLQMDGLYPDDIMAKKLKNGNEKVKTVYQWACSEVRKSIYAEKSIENNGKIIYVESTREPDESMENALDRLYIRAKKYYDIGTESDYGYTGHYDAYKYTMDTIHALNLTDRQKLVLHYRLQGISVSDIGKKLGVSQQAISKTLSQIQKKMVALNPDNTRYYKPARASALKPVQAEKPVLTDCIVIMPDDIPQAISRKASAINLASRIDPAQDKRTMRDDSDALERWHKSRVLTNNHYYR